MNEYKFELHTHTVHSDGSFTPKTLVESAKALGYKGIALTDHNVSSGCKEAVEWGKKLGVIVIPGIEWTTFYGHIVVLGGNSKVEWTDITRENIVEKIMEAKASGDIVGLAHPYRVGYPVCTGGRNQFPSEIFSHLDFYEAISGELEDPTNKRSIEEYKLLKEAGYKITPTYGRDWHGLNDREGATYGATYLLSREDITNVEQALSLIKEGNTKVGNRENAINLLEEKV